MKQTWTVVTEGPGSVVATVKCGYIRVEDGALHVYDENRCLTRVYASGKWRYIERAS